MDAISASTIIGRPREEVFDYLLDIANHAEFSDHYLSDWRLTRVDSNGLGAGARFRIKAPLSRFSWGDMTISDVQEPYRIVARGRCGKYNRVRMIAVYTLSSAPSHSTRVEYTFETESALPSDRVLEALDRPWYRRQIARAMRRLRLVLEEDRDRGHRPSVAAR